MKTIRHGTQGGYTHGGCRCESCKTAMSDYKRAWRRRNSEREKSKDRNYYAVNRDRFAAYRSLPERRAAEAAAKRAEYKQRGAEIRARVAAYQATKPAARHLSQAKRRAILKATDQRLIATKDWRRLCARYDNLCAYCRASKPLTVDHIIPLIRGGRHAIGNLIPACGPCNSSKNARLLIEWEGRPTTA